MADASFYLTTAVWGMASAVAVATLGVLSLLGGRTRPRGALAFGLFAISWGAQLLLGNLSTALQVRPLVAPLYLAFLAFSFPATYFLVEFAASQTERGSRRWHVARIAAATASMTGAVLLAAAPELFLAEIRASPTGLVILRGPLFVPLVVAPQFSAFALALLALKRAAGNAPTPRTRVRAATLLAGLGVYVGFAAGNNLTFYVSTLALYADPARNTTFALSALVFLALSAVALRVASTAYVSARAARTRPEARAYGFVALAIAVPFTWGLAEGVLVQSSFPRLETAGLWRLAAVGIVAYGLARWRLFDLPQRATRAAADAGGASVALAGGAAAYGAGTLIVPGTLIPALAGLAVMGVTILPGMRFVRRVFSGGGIVDDARADHVLYGQRIEAYRAALEASIARGTLDEDDKFLAALRERFGVDASEHRLLLHYARSSVLIATDEGAEAYERLRLLGEGGAGRTWLARDRVRDRLVVLKEPLERWQRDPRLREDVLREARLAARVRHPNVVQVEEVIESKDVPILVMEYVEGGTLADQLRRRGTIPWPEAVRLITRVLQGVEAIHANGIVHRDIKPSNIMLTADGAPKVGDFGIAVSLAPGMTVREGATTFSGTLGFVAPEVRAGGKGDVRADVYAAGAVLHSLVHGGPPGATPAITPLPAPLAAAIARALADDPSRRQPTARALAEELTSMLPLKEERP